MGGEAESLAEGSTHPQGGRSRAPEILSLWSYGTNRHEYFWLRHKSPRCVHDCNDHNNHDDDDSPDFQHIILVSHTYASLFVRYV